MTRLYNFFLHGTSFALLVSLVSSCSNHCESNDEVLCKTVHRYGVPLAPQEWVERGQNGQVISMRKDGVTLCRSYDAGVLHGECTYSFPHTNRIEKKEVYDRGNMQEEVFHYANGHPERKVVYDSSGNRSITTWYDGGAPQCSENLQNDSLVQGEYYTVDQHLEAQVENGHGLKVCRDGQGLLLSVDKIEGGQLELRTTYYPSGIPESATPYVNGQIQGERCTWSTGGEPATVEIWNGNLQQGMTTVYEHGEKRAEIPYVNGFKHGLERDYRDNGQVVVQEITWIRGKRHGPTTIYINGTSQIDWYFNGSKVVNKATFDMMTHQ